MVTITGVGTVVVTARQTGNNEYNPAVDIDQGFIVDKATPIITWSNPADITVGTALSSNN